jgi:hypothetical protein
MSADENIKKFTLVGGKSELEALGKQGSRKRRGGAAGPSNVPPGPSYQMTSANVQKAQVQAPVPVPVQNGAAYNQHKNVKVILTPKKKKSAVVLEAPKKKKVPITLATTQSKTRKVAKKIRMNISNMSKRMTRANEIRKESKSLDIEKIKTALKSSGLIKESTKAPDAILRSMYTDFHLLKNKAL